MAHVRFTKNLARLFAGLDSVDVDAATVAEAVSRLSDMYPRLTSYLVDEHGALRRHVNIFVDDVLVQDRSRLSDPLAQDAELYVVQALSGG